MLKKTNKNKKRKSAHKPKKKMGLPFTFGNVHSDQRRILMVVIVIIFMVTGMVYANVIKKLNSNQFLETSDRKNIALEKEISQLVQGYPIARMTPYISQKDPKVAAFLVAIAKKESNWGKRRPVLDGQDCYNYWGFRLQTDSMGSGGHTCFDSPQEAVDTVASRIDEMVKKENIDSVKDMIVWKCGYDCQDEVKSASERKWIRDVNIYYSKLANYL